MNLVDLDAPCLVPELKPPIAHMIPNQIHSDPHEPGIHAATAAKRLAAPISIPETVLSQRLRKIHIANRSENEPEHSCPVLLHEPFKVIDLQSRVLHAHRNEPGCHRWLHTLL